MNGGPEQHEVEPDPWWHPHHWMHHSPEIITGFSIIIVALLGYLGIRHKRRHK